MTKKNIQLQDRIIVALDVESMEKAKEIVKIVKDSKLKVQAAIHEDSVRVSGKKRDELQETMRLLRATETLELDLQFTNFRD